MISVLPILKRSYSVPRHSAKKLLYAFIKKSAAAGLRHDKLSIRAELFMANLFDYNHRQQRAIKQVKKYGPGRAWLPEVVVEVNDNISVSKQLGSPQPPHKPETKTATLPTVEVTGLGTGHQKGDDKEPNSNERPTKGVIPTNDFWGNTSFRELFMLANQNNTFRNVMKYFYEGQNHVYLHLKQFRDKEGKPIGIRNTAATESWKSKNNPVGKWGISRIVMNSDLLSADGKLRIDKTFVFRALVHEGIHARMFERKKSTKGTFEGYSGHKDFREKAGEWHHNQMAMYNRGELIEAMKTFDNQLRKQGEKVPRYHTEEWYEAMSWFGLRRTQAWEDLEKNNPEKADMIYKEIKKQLNRNQIAQQSHD